MRSRSMVAAAVVIAIALAGSGAGADPLIGSPLVGEYCTKGSAITGTGATFANNAHQLVFIPAYAADCGKGTVTYTSTGSGAGKTAFMNHTHAFGMSDEPLSTDEIVIGSADANGLQGRVSPAHHIPLAIGAVTVSYNLTSCGIGQEQLSLRSPSISAIFTGAVTRWNDPLLAVENPKLSTCSKAIKLAVRSDGSGTTYVFKDYLSKRNPHWNVWKQNQLNTQWPSQDLGLNVPMRGTGNGGVAALIKNTDGAIGYVEYSTAKRNLLTWAKVDNAIGQFTEPEKGAAANCQDSAIGATHPVSSMSPGWDAVSITDGVHPTGYAICSFTYALVYNNLKSAFGGAMSATQAQTLVDYLGLALEDGPQSALDAAGYAHLPPTLQAIGRAGLATIAYQ